MDHNRKSLRVGAAAILCATALRLGSGPVAKELGRLLSSPKFLSFLIYAETGRHVRFPEATVPMPQTPGESPPPILPLPVKEPLSFSEADLDDVQIRYLTNRRPDLEKLLTRPLSWNLTEEAPTVLILHTHATESYTKGTEGYTETSAFRTLDEEYNMVSIGDALARALEAGGIRVIHDRTLHDYPSYNSSYAQARKTIQKQLEENPSIRLVLDLHRDASGDITNQIRPVASVKGQTAAQLMLVMGMAHEGSEENLALGLKLHTVLERLAPGIMRPMSLRNSRFNQDLCPGALLVEVGAAGNTREQALLAAEILAEGILALAEGTGDFQNKKSDFLPNNA